MAIRPVTLEATSHVEPPVAAAPETPAAPSTPGPDRQPSGDPAAPSTPEWVSKSDFENHTKQVMEVLRGLAQNRGQQTPEPPEDPATEQARRQKEYESFFANGPDYVEQRLAQVRQEMEWKYDYDNAMNWVKSQPGYSVEMDNRLGKIAREYGLAKLLPSQAVKLAYKIDQASQAPAPAPGGDGDLKKTVTPPGTRGLADTGKGKSLKEFMSKVHSLNDADFQAGYRELIEAAQRGELEVGR